MAFYLLNSLGFFVLLIGWSSLGVRGCTCVLLLVSCSVLGRSVASVLVLVCSVLLPCFPGNKAEEQKNRRTEARMTLDVRSLVYAPSVSVFPARSGFTPGWVYVHVCGRTHCCCCRVLFLTVVLVAIVDTSHQHYHASSQNIPPHIEITLRNKARM